MKQNWREIVARGLLISSLAGVIVYGYAYLAVAKYLGFTFGSSGIIASVDSSTPLLRKEDRIEQVNGIPWKEYAPDLRQVRFSEYRPGDTIPLLIGRGDTTIPVDWPLPRPQLRLVLSRLSSQLLFGPFFWLLGLAAYGLIRPHDTRWLLLVALCSLIAVFIVLGTISTHRVWYSALLMRAVAWPMAVVLLHYHWIFPRPLGDLPGRFTGGIYALAGAMALAALFQTNLANAYVAALAAGLLGSALLLIWHAVRQPDSRRYLRLLALTLLLLVAGAFSLAWLGRLLHQPNLVALVIAFVPLLPLAYLYLAYQRQIGGMETRPDRWLGFLVYGLGMTILAMLALGGALSLTFGAGTSGMGAPNPAADLLVGSGLVLLLGLVGTRLYPRFQREFERRIMGISLPSDEMVAAYTRQIAASPDRDHLRTALEQDIFPSLLIRQAAVWYFPEAGDHGVARRAEPVVCLGLSQTQLPAPHRVSALLPGAAEPAAELAAAPDWVRLALPMEYRGHPIGLALFGRRDPDDEYTPADLPILRTLLAQTALAVVNTDQAALLRALQRHEIERQEAERARLGRDLHDVVLTQMSIMSHCVEADNPAFEAAYQAGVDCLRDLMAGLLPQSLEKFGLYTALTELQDDLYQRIAMTGAGGPRVRLELKESVERYPAEVQLALFRIVQQASLNALQHAQAANLEIGGELAAGRIDLWVADDGVGFEAQPGELIPMLVHGHYGLSNMYQRAALVGAYLTVDAAPGRGVRVRITWSEAG